MPERGSTRRNGSASGTRSDQPNASVKTRSALNLPAASKTKFWTMVVTVGGLAATVINAVLTPGEAGLYQVTIQIPATAPIGMIFVRQ